jgi:phosphate transport system protein
MFVDELLGLREQLIHMGQDVISMVTKAISNLVATDEEEARAVIKADKGINAQENSIVDTAIRLIATNQPVAGDLRFLASTLRLATEWERIGDLGSNLARRTLGLIQLNNIGALTEPLPDDLNLMAAKALGMLKMALEAFTERSPDLAEKVLSLDDEIDDLNQRIKDSLLAKMYDNGRLSAWGLEIINTAAHLERLGDHATNVAEETIYMAKGKNVRHKY